MVLKMKKKCYPKYAYYIYYLLSSVIFLFSIGPWIINTNDLLSIKISCSITMLVFSLLLFFSALWNGQFYTIDKGFIVCKNCFCVIQKISIEDAICIIQELPTYFNWMTSTSKKWICIYCKNSNFRFETGCSNSRKKKGIQIIYTDNNYELIDKLCQVNII